MPVSDWIAEQRTMGRWPLAFESTCQGGVNRWSIKFVGDTRCPDMAAIQYWAANEAKLIELLRDEGWFHSFCEDKDDAIGPALQELIDQRQSIKQSKALAAAE